MPVDSGNIKKFLAVYEDKLNSVMGELSCYVVDELALSGHTAGGSPTPEQYFPPNKPLSNLFKSLYRINAETYNVSLGSPISRPQLLLHVISNIDQYYEGGRILGLEKGIPVKYFDDACKVIDAMKNGGVLNDLEQASLERIAFLEERQLSQPLQK